MGPPTAKENPNYLGCPPAGPQSSSHIYIDSIFSYKYINFALGDLMNTVGDSTRDPSSAAIRNISPEQYRRLRVGGGVAWIKEILPSLKGKNTCGGGGGVGRQITSGPQSTSQFYG